MVNTSKANNFRTNQFKKSTNKPKGVGNHKGNGAKYKKTAHRNEYFAKSKEVQKMEYVNKIQQRRVLKAQKQKEINEERAKAKHEKEEKIRQYKKKRLEKTKAISKRTQRGQPLMKDRMQLILKQIQEMKKNG